MSDKIEYFELKYLEEINELFNEFKEINKYYNLSFLENQNYCEFYDFIYKNIYIHILEDEIDSEEEENILL